MFSPLVVGHGQGKPPQHAHSRERIDAERAVPGPLAKRRTDDFEETLVRVDRGGRLHAPEGVLHGALAAGGAPAAGAGCNDDRLVLYAGREHLMTLPRGHAGPKGRRGRVGVPGMPCVWSESL